MFSPVRGTVVAATFAAGLALPGVAGAMEEIVVTAQKRSQSLQEVPLSVSAYSEQFLEQINVNDFRDLVALTPGFAGETDDGFIDALAIRGISTNDFGMGGDPSVAIFVDGVHEGRNGGVVTSFLDVASVEVVRGPQNTLFGRNAIAGAVSIATHKPENSLGGKLSAAVEQYDHYDVSGTINAPISDKLFFRASAQHYEENGYLDNLAGGRDLGAHDRDAVQAALRWLNEGTDATLTTFFESRSGDPSVYWSTFPLNGAGLLDPDGSPLPNDKASSDLLAANQGRNESDIFRATLNIEQQLPAGLTLTSITGFKRYDFRYVEDYDATGGFVNDYGQSQDVTYLSQEIRLNSPDTGPWIWFVGVSGYAEKVDATFRNRYDEDQLCRALGVTEVADIGGPVTGCDDPLFEAYWGADIDPGDLLANKAEVNINSGRYRGFALYGDATWAVTDRLDLILGARFTWDEKKFGITVPDSGGALGNNLTWEFNTGGQRLRDKDHWSGFTPRVALNYEWNEQWSFYANVSTGYKTGGYSTFGVDLAGDPDEDGLVPAGTRPKKFDSERVTSYEAGAKARLLDNTLQANISLYHFDFDDLQLTYFAAGSQLTDNVAKTSASGVELELRWAPAANFDVLASMAYIDSEIDNVDPQFLADGGCMDCAGNQLWFSPNFMSTEIATYRFSLNSGAEVFVSGEHHYQDKMFAGPDNLALAVAPDYHEFNFRLGYRNNSAWSVVAYVKNAFNERYFERGWENADADNLAGYGLVNSLVWPSKPRTFGVKLDWVF